jgi:hypothetical protein
MNTLEFEQLVDDAEYIDYNYGEDAYVRSIEHDKKRFKLLIEKHLLKNLKLRFLALMG